MSRPIIAHIRLDAFRHNYRVAKQSHGGKALAVIKANAYGHGAVHCAKAIEGEADGFAVACLEEALQLREAGLPEPILLLEGFFEAIELPEIVANDLWIVVHAQWQIEILLAAKLAKPLHVWLKMDSGMHRVGLSPSEYGQAYERLKNHKNVANIVMMTHFANADNLSSNHTLQQIEIFHNATHGLGSETSLENSAAILGWKKAICIGDTKNQWTRPGIMLYGADPLMNTDTKLKPVMQLNSQIISIRTIKQGEPIGYGSIFTAERDTVVGVVACGYADGYPRSAVTGTPMAVEGKMTRLIGRVSMDMLFVDLTDIPNASIGSSVELWGNNVSANAVAISAGTIAYELFCNVKRAHFQYFDAANI
ncbi:MAG: alanine racemase [Methylotenera sp.]|uniref:alanine racemase n=1 Tax=Methylotenera sp. TaxID=2051956 RepID=UPI002488DB51|nr:alanine racemase [Methylotenera sp.]MDI1308525.1 alanine racemase [Methylotenera sp.]